jgi:hypothetical protein
VRKHPPATVGRRWNDEWAIKQVEQHRALKTAFEGLPPEADDYLHRVMVAGIWDNDGNYIPDPNFWPDAVDLQAGRIVLRKPQP